jgi:hypothetical protein
VSAPSPTPATLHLILDASAQSGVVSPTAGSARTIEVRLARLIGRARPAAIPARSGRAWAARLLGAPLPIAWAAAWRDAHAGQTAGGEVATCLLFDPVEMAAGMNSVAMRPPAGVLDPAVLASCARLLGPVLAARRGTLQLAAGRLLAILPGSLALRTVPLDECAGRDLRDCLPNGPDAGALRRLITECQMVLHSAAEDLQTPLAGINGVWPWGEGTRHPSAEALAPAAQALGPGEVAWEALQRAPLRWLLTDDPLLAALAAHRSAARSGSGSAACACAASTGTQSLVDRLSSGALGGDAAWHGALAEPALAALLDGAWRALWRGRLNTLAISFWPGPPTSSGTEWRLCRSDLWRWWRAPRRPWVAADHDDARAGAFHPGSPPEVEG